MVVAGGGGSVGSVFVWRPGWVFNGLHGGENKYVAVVVRSFAMIIITRSQAQKDKLNITKWL